MKNREPGSETADGGKENELGTERGEGRLKKKRKKNALRTSDDIKKEKEMLNEEEEPQQGSGFLR